MRYRRNVVMKLRKKDALLGEKVLKERKLMYHFQG
jgi:hypothetical protein